MTDADAFRRAIAAAPDDDTPRLVFADYLDEHGEPDRAEFIRVQCELARQPGKLNHYHWRGKDRCKRCRRDALRERERELRPHAERGWRAFVQATLGAEWVPAREFDWEFRRGFVAAVSAPLAVLFGGPCATCRGASVGMPLTCGRCGGSGHVPGHAAALFAAQPVTEVAVSDREPTRFADPGSPGPGNFRGEDTHFWVTRDAWEGGSADNLPAEFRPMPGCLRWDLGPAGAGCDVEGHYYPTRQAAREALSARAVALGRRLAGLPPLTRAAAAPHEGG